MRTNFALLFFSATTLLIPPSPQLHAEDDYELMKLFAETFQQVEANYVRDVDRRELMEAAIQGMLHHLDQYSSFIPPQSVNRFNQMVEQEFGGIGITLSYRGGQLIVVSPLPDTPAYRAGIRAGDVIAEIEGESTDGVTLAEAVKKLQGPVGRPVAVTVARHNEPDTREFKMVRQLIKAPTVRGHHYDENDAWEYLLEGEQKIGYLRLSHFSRHSTEEVRKAVDSLVDRGLEGLVIDLRFNPGGLLESAIELADLFLEDGDIVSVRGRNVPERSWEAKKDGTYPQFPMAILVNNYSASASEVLSACLQDNQRAAIIGERTWGKGSVQNVIQMEDGESALKLTTASYHRPSGVNIHRFREMKETDQWGVTPDEGFVIPYSRDEWRKWDADRSRRDVLHSHVGDDNTEGKAEDDPANGNLTVETADENHDELFEDRQLNKAVDYIRAQLGKESPAEVPSSDESKEAAAG